MASRPRTPKANPEPYPPGWEPFLAAIKADMDDDTPRLVFADWLEENDDPERAELIRLQCEWHRRGYDDSGNADTRERIDTLLKANWDRWVAGFPRWFQANRFNHYFVRGFVPSVAITAATFLKDGAVVARLTPIQELTLYRANVASLRSPVLAEIGGLSISPVNSTRVEALASNANLSLLRRLFVSNGRDERDRPTVHISGKSVRRLLANPTLAGLREFELNGTSHGNTVAASLAAAPFHSLTRLHLFHSELTTDAFRTLIHSPSARSLRGLYLAGNPIGDEGIRALVDSQAVRGMDNLNLSGCGLTRMSAELLSGWPGLRTVRWMTLDDNALSTPEEALILASPHAQNLTGFRIQFPRLEPTGATSVLS